MGEITIRSVDCTNVTFLCYEVKATWDLSVSLLTSACESTVISKLKF